MVVVFRLFDMTITIKEEMNGISDDITAVDATRDILEAHKLNKIE